MLNVFLSFQRLILKTFVLKALVYPNQIRIVLAHFNINSLRNKHNLLADQIEMKVDVWTISEAKQDYSFPAEQFKILGYALPFRLDWN